MPTRDAIHMILNEMIRLGKSSLCILHIKFKKILGGLMKGIKQQAEQAGDGKPRLCCPGVCWGHFLVHPLVPPH